MPASGGGGWVLKKVGAWRRRSICSTSQPTISRPTTPKPPSPTPQGARRSPTFRNLFAALGQRSSTRPSKAHRHTSEDDIEVDVPLSIEHHQSSASIESPRSSNHYETMSSLHPESPGGGGGGGGGGGELEAVAPQVREHALKSFYATDIEAAYIIRSNNRNLGNMRPLHRDGTSALEREYDTADSWTLGKGGFGRVITARSRRTGALFAVKSVPLADLCEEDLAQLRTEIEIQRKLEHPNIVRIYEVFEDDWDAEMHLVMEMCEQCLMSHLLQSPDGHDEARVATMVSQMLSAILFCHRSGVVHRDIKLQNFMYASPAADAELKLIDFGFACEVRRGDAEQMSERLGTPSYMAPELCGPPPLCYDSKVDMWATGVVTYQLLCGDRPFHHESKEELRRRIREDEVRYAWGPWRTISDDAKDFCQKLLRRDATTRLSASAALEHKWIRERHRGGSSGGPGGGGAGGGAKRRQPLPREVIKSLRGFEQASDLKKLALEAVAVSAPPAHLTELRAVFARMDTSGRGTLTRAQFHEALAVRDEQSQQSRGTRPSSMRREQSSPSLTTAPATATATATATTTTTTTVEVNAPVSVSLSRAGQHGGGQHTAVLWCVGHLRRAEWAPAVSGSARPLRGGQDARRAAASGVAASPRQPVEKRPRSGKCGGGFSRRPARRQTRHCRAAHQTRFGQTRAVVRRRRASHYGGNVSRALPCVRLWHRLRRPLPQRTVHEEAHAALRRVRDSALARARLSAADEACGHAARSLRGGCSRRCR